MIYIEKANTPGFLIKYQADPNSHYSDLSGQDKLRLKEQLVDEQNGLCAYCMSRIRPNNNSMKIEHHLPQSKYPDRDLDYKNLFGVCNGEKGGGQRSRLLDQTCDTRKKNCELHFSPIDRNVEQLVTYQVNGLIVPAKALDIKKRAEIEYDLNEVLNLNHRQLIANRKNVLDTYKLSLERRYGNKELSIAFWKKEEESYRNGSRKDQIYKGILLDYIVKKKRRATS